MGFFGPYVAAEVKIGRLASPSLSRKPHQVYCLCFDTIGSEFQHNCFLESVSGSTLAKASLINAICRAVHLFCSLSLSPDHHHNNQNISLVDSRSGVLRTAC